MKSKAIILAATLVFALAFAGCSDSVVGTDDEATAPLVKKVKPPPVPDDPPGTDDPTDFRSVTVDFVDAGYKIRSDGRGPYEDGTCGVWANIGNWDDFRLDPDRDYKRKLARSCGDPRSLVFEFPDWRGTVTVGAFVNVDGLDALTVGVPTETTAQFNVCNTLVFEGVLAERTSASTWAVTATGANADAVCADGSGYNLPFTLIITE